jgi:hypothetical protein
MGVGGSAAGLDVVAVKSRLGEVVVGMRQQRAVVDPGVDDRDDDGRRARRAPRVRRVHVEQAPLDVEQRVRGRAEGAHRPEDGVGLDADDVRELLELGEQRRREAGRVIGHHLLPHREELQVREVLRDLQARGHDARIEPVGVVHDELVDDRDLPALEGATAAGRRRAVLHVENRPAFEREADEVHLVVLGDLQLRRKPAGLWSRRKRDGEQVGAGDACREGQHREQRRETESGHRVPPGHRQESGVYRAPLRAGSD